MKIELSDEQITFLLRVLECNYSEDETDFDSHDIADRGKSAEIISLLIGGNRKLYKRYNKDIISKQIPVGRLFMGVGWISKVRCNYFHKRLQHAFSELSGLQQNGGQGTEFDEAMDKECKENICVVADEIATALKEAINE